MRSLALVLLLAACASQKSQTSTDPAPSQEAASETRVSDAVGGEGRTQELEVRPPREPLPWTGEFRERAVLLAQSIRIEGPEGLLDHCVVRSDDALFVRSARTTEEGFLQVTQPKASSGGETVRGQLDQWQLAATGQIVVLENPAFERVVVRAQGEVYWRTPGGAEFRGATFERVGELDSSGKQ